MRVTLDHLTKKFGDVVAVSDFSAELEHGELIALLGPSGCGKSTILNMLAGIVPATGGKILFDGEDATDMPPEKRGIGLVFQNYALYPHMTVLQNICFPLEVQRIPKADRLSRAEEIAKLVHVEALLKRRPAELSGGQQQRVAIARALVKNPHLLLLDEPLSNLDARLRLEMREEIRRIQQRTGVTTIFVTHDQEEAMSISDRIVLMKAGALQQSGVPQ
ncbi:MAG: ABC transporter ATP-binding protein, partial [Clostridiales bacterium]|nr:ABC transporter ATP-binding protein [Clostridiales bacterium]